MHLFRVIFKDEASAKALTKELGKDAEVKGKEVTISKDLWRTEKLSKILTKYKSKIYKYEDIHAMQPEIEAKEWAARKK